jgi:hypothetical protein
MEYEKGAVVMSDKDEDNVIDFVIKSKMKKMAKENGRDIDKVTDEDFATFLKAFFGDYKGSGYNPE